MATAGAIVGLRVAGVEVEDIGTTAKTLPEFPQMWADMLAGRLSPREYDESDVRVRPGRGSRPRTKTRPDHADAHEAMVVTVDRGRWGCALDGDPDRRVTAMRARELGRTPIVVGDEVGIVGDCPGKPDTLARIVRRGERPNGAAAHRRRHRSHRARRRRQCRSAADGGRARRPAAAHRSGPARTDRRLCRRAGAHSVPDQDRPGAAPSRSRRSSPTST